MLRERSADGQTFVNVIGWFSTCLLVAGWGPVLDPFVRNFWGSAGLFGLISAVTLQRLQRSRHTEALHKQQVATEKRMKRDLSTLIKHGDATDAVDIAVHEIIEKWEAETGIARDTGASESTALCQPIVITTPDARQRGPELGRFRMDAVLRHISRSSVGIEHDEPLKMGEVLLNINLEENRTIGLLVELHWWSQLPSGEHWSGGKILDVRP